MGGQSIERRDVLRILALATAASEFTGFEKWVFAHDHQHSKPVQPPATDRKPYEPHFFSPEEYALITLLSDMIIPDDGTPGARRAGVPEFIDFMVAGTPGIQYSFRQGLTWMNAHAVLLHDKVFTSLDHNQQNAILEHLAYKAKYRDGEEEGRSFFNLIRNFTVMGFYTSQMGMEQLGSPGLQQYYPASPACPHTNNRDHIGLKPKY